MCYTHNVICIVVITPMCVLNTCISWVVTSCWVHLPLEILRENMFRSNLINTLCRNRLSHFYHFAKSLELQENGDRLIPKGAGFKWIKSWWTMKYPNPLHIGLLYLTICTLFLLEWIHLLEREYFNFFSVLFYFLVWRRRSLRAHAHSVVSLKSLLLRSWNLTNAS